MRSNLPRPSGVIALQVADDDIADLIMIQSRCPAQIGGIVDLLHINQTLVGGARHDGSLLL
jgi:hypothetical protein